MTTVILVGLIVVLLAAAAYVGVLLVRRTRSARAEPGPDDERPRTVADLVKRRTGPEAGELSGDELFVPAVPRQDGLAVPAAPDDASVEPEAAPPSPELATPAGGLEVGDAPWRRAARMAGAEPGGTWATAPLPVVAENAATGDEAEAGAPDRPTSASSAVVIVSRAAPAPTAATLSGELEAMRAAAARPEPPVRESEQEAAEPALVQPAAPSPWTEPSAPVAPPAAVAEQPAADEQPSAPAPVPRRLSDPDLTPLMGIPIIRSAADAPVAEAGPEPLAEAPAEVSDDEPVAVPVPRTVGAPTPDDDVVFLLPATPTGSFPVVRPAASGSAQPVWFRVVRRDGEPVSAAVVALLDDHGREVDTTKTAPDGGGELRTPHGGRFMMIVSADGYQPRAAILSVGDQPVELALLLPRSAAISGSVRTGGASMRDARVVVRQDHDVVDEATTGGDGHYRFDDLAEGTYVVAVTAGASRAVARVSLAEGADVRVDLDLAGTADAR